MKNNYCFFQGSVCQFVIRTIIIFLGLQIQAQTDYIVTNNSDSGSGSLREAITLANSDPAKDNILFDIPGEGPHRITLLSVLPDIIEPIQLDGTSQPGYSWESPQIIVDGNGVVFSGFNLIGNSSGSTIKGFVIGGFFDSVNPSNSTPAGVIANNTGSHTIAGNFIGIEADGSTKLYNRNGILLVNSSDNTIGGIQAIDRNIISGNFRGIVIDGGANYSLISERNKITGNFIGTNSLGLASVSNNIGIYFRNANNNIIGGASEFEINIISGNLDQGISIAGHQNKIFGNHIGIGTDGSPVPNGNLNDNVVSGVGINIRGREFYEDPLPTGNLIGGANPGEGNIISGNEQGAYEYGSGTIVFGNRIGTDITGNIPIPNVSGGIEMGGEYYILGGPNPGEGNIISSNGGLGQVEAVGKYGKIQGNLIGTDASGEAPLAPNAPGIFSFGGESILIGGVNEGEGNIIAGDDYAVLDLEFTNNWRIFNNIIGFENSINRGGVIKLDSGTDIVLGGIEAGMSNIIRGGNYGVIIENTWDFGGYAMQAKVSGNSIYGNSLMGIDILPFGLNSNDPGDADAGHNRLQNFPVLENNAALESGNIKLSYFVDSAPGNSTYPIQVEFFIDAGNRQAKEYLFYDTFTEADYNAGIPKEISVPLPTGSGFVVGDFILSTATDAGGNTSEFSASVEVTGTCSGPVAVCKDPFTLELGPDGTASLTVEAVDNGSTTSCGFQSMTIDKTEFTCEDIGDQVVTLSVTDINNVTVTCTTTVTVQDKILPELTAVLDKEVSVDENCQFAVPDYTGETTATDNCSDPVVTQSPAIGTLLTGHNTTQLITLTADDGNGNSNSTSFLITLKDNTKPVVSPVATKEGILDANCKFVVPDYRSEASATDNCSTPSVVQSPEAGTELSGHGTIQEILITANDGNGNSSSISFNLTLRDDTDPTITSVQDQTLIADDNCEATLGDYSSLVTVSDNCDADLTIIQDPVSGTVISTETIVTLTVTDDAQNFSFTTFTASLEGGTTTTYYVDGDGDGYGVDDPQTNIESCIEPESGYATVAGDCNDNDLTIYPGAFDIRGDGIDQDCDGIDEPLDCIGTDRLDVTQVCPENSTVETWVISNPSTCTVQVRWEIKNTTLSGSLVANPGDTQFNTPLTDNNRTMLIIYWNDKNGREKKSNLVSRGTDCTSTGAFIESQSLSGEIEGMVYPNPIADNGFWISFPPEVGDQTIHAAIYTLNGQKLIEKYFQVPSGGGDLFWSFNHDSWEQGLYPLVLTGSSQQLKTTLIK
ncbi:MopE-related protein [Salinimicrobium flavum]|uniref:MopE-related protein n=1 Tax=Salinimicrobium flavum TaxID=1737065 RepID=A0ABW5IUM0_9FLAO